MKRSSRAAIRNSRIVPAQASIRCIDIVTFPGNLSA